MASMNTRLNIEKLDENIVQKHGGFHGIQDEKRVWFEVELQGAQGDHEAEVFQVSNDDAVVAQRRLEDKQHEEKINTDDLGAEGNVAEKKKVKESMKANLGKLLNYNAWSTRWSPVREDGTISDIGEWQDDQWVWKVQLRRHVFSWLHIFSKAVDQGSALAAELEAICEALHIEIGRREIENKKIVIWCDSSEAVNLTNKEECGC
ncbi:hypothetical protein Tco_1004719 [Tanacetum coccineum]|uniref:RNase H type-1 domain-containing protein n=1 Tax=Tanacetum coccineum TaxID=301880 RepID=A0ABQ5FCP2_9ASTR